MKTNILRKILLCFALLLPILSIAQQRNFLHYSTDDGLPSPTLYSIIDDTMGFIWVSTPFGVSRFDGTYFENFTIEDGLPDSDILNIDKDKQGRLWFQGYNGKIGYYDYQQFKVLDQVKFNAFPESFYQDASDSIHFWNHNQHLTVKCNPDGKIITHWRNNKMFLILENSKEKKQLEIPNLARNSYSYHLSGDSILFFQNNRERWKLSLLTKDTIMQLTDIDVMPNGTDQFCRIYRYGSSIFVSSNTKGLYQFSFEQNKLKSKTIMFPNNGIPSYFFDRHHNQWLGSIRDGLYLIPDAKMEAYIFKNQNTELSNSVCSIYEDSSQQIYLGYTNGALQRLKKDGSNDYIINTSLESNQAIKYILPLKNGSIIFKSFYNYQLDPQQYCHKLTSILKHPHKDAYMDQDSLWIGTINGIEGYTFKENKSIQFYESEWQDRTHSIFRCKNGIVWFYRNVNGIGFILHGKTHYLSTEANLLSSHKDLQLSSLDVDIAKNYRFIDIQAINDSLILFLSDHHGLVLYHTESQRFDTYQVKSNFNSKSLPETSEMLSNNGTSLMIINNQVWIGTNKGVSVFEIKNTSHLIHRFNLTKRDGLLANEVNVLYHKDHRIYVGTTNGLNIFNKETLPLQNGFCKLLVSRVEIVYPHSSEKINFPKARISVDENHKSINLHCNLISYGSKEFIQLRYKVDSSDWLYVNGQDFTLNFTKGGLKDILIQARKGGGSWCSPVTLQLSIPIPYYNRWWFYLLLFASFLLISRYLLMYFIRKEKQALRKQQEMKLKLVSLEMKAAQAMMNPHFLYNILNSIQYFINSNNILNANRYLTQFAKLMRLNLTNLREKYITLANELHLIGSYLDLEKLRFPDKISYHIIVDPEIHPEEVYIPNMLIQPLVENSIWHGLLPSAESGEISIHLFKEEDQLMIHIQDTGIGLNRSKALKETTTTAHKSLGLDMMKQRMEMLTESTDKKHSIEIYDRLEKLHDRAGTVAIIIVPLISTLPE